MKKTLLCIVLFVIYAIVNAQVGIGTSNPHESAALDVTSTTRGFLPPRMTEIQMNDIANPAEGLIVYCTDCDPKGLYVNSSHEISDFEPIQSGETTSSTVISDCETNGFEGSYVINEALTSNNKFSVTILNNSFANATISFATSDIVLSGTAASGITVNSVSPTSSTINSGGTVTVEYSLSGTPSSVGDLTVDWSKISLSCTKSTYVSNGDATFVTPQTFSVVSIFDSGVDIQGVIDNATNQIIINVPYTNGLGSYDAYTGTAILGIPGEGGDLNEFSISYPAGNFSSTGTIPVTIIVGGSDTSYNAEKLAFGVIKEIVRLPFMVNGNNKGNIILQAIGGIPDRMFNQLDNAGNLTHQFIYLPIVAEDGRTWLNNNLGADYANMNHPDFDPVQQATNSFDFKATGSLFQWGRKADGHELITRTATSVDSVYPAANRIPSNTGADVPTHPNFQLVDGPTEDWRATNNNDLWNVNGVNNPCPEGYRPPTRTEFENLMTSSNITNNSLESGYSGTVLKFPTGVPLQRHPNEGHLYPNSSYSGTYSSIYASITPRTVTSRRIQAFIFSSSAGNYIGDNIAKSYGMPVRCIKNQ